MPESILSAIVTAQGDLKHFPKVERILFSSQNKPIELIVVVNTKNPSGREFLQQLDEAIRNFENLQVTTFGFPNQSPGEARNFGYRKSNSDLVAFWDYDDVADVDKFLLMAKHAIEWKSNTICGGYEQVDLSNGKLTEFHPKNFHTQNYATELFFDLGLWRYIFRKSALKQANFQNFTMGEDQIFLLENQVFNENTVIYPQYVYRYFRGNVGQLTSSYSAMEGITKFLKYINVHIKKQRNKDDLHFAQCMYVKQCLTAIRRGRLKLKLRCLVSLIVHIKYLGSPVVISLLKKDKNAFA